MLIKGSFAVARGTPGDGGLFWRRRERLLIRPNSDGINNTNNLGGGCREGRDRGCLVPPAGPRSKRCEERAQGPPTAVKGFSRLSKLTCCVVDTIVCCATSWRRTSSNTGHWSRADSIWVTRSRR